MSALFKPGFINLCPLWIAKQFDLFYISLYFTHSLDSNSWQLELEHSQIFLKSVLHLIKEKKWCRFYIFFPVCSAHNCIPCSKKQASPRNLKYDSVSFQEWICWNTGVWAKSN